jgi:hypothetical protein
MKQSLLILYFNGFLCISWSFGGKSSSIAINVEFKGKEVGTDLN